MLIGWNEFILGKFWKIEDGVDKVVDIYEGYSYVFELVGTDTWTDGIAPEAIVCDGDEIVALGITAVP